MELAPIEIVFYDDEDKETVRFTRSRIPSYILDLAIDLGGQLDALGDAENTQPAAVKTAPLFDFVVELFGNKFTREELKQKTDLVECMSVYQAVLARANGIAVNSVKANPTPPSLKKK